MARIGTLRVADVLDYERDIKGKGLVRLRAGVGAGKNYWVRHLPNKYPDLQILMITSRKNVAEAEALKLDISTGVYISQLIDIANREWYEDVPGSLVVCTNAYIEYFLRNIYDEQNPMTHLWNKFDVIFVDEAHSLTSDASFANSSFQVAQFIRHVRRYNTCCDVVLMSGTQEPVDWLFSEAYLGEEYTIIDLYDQCIHLVPDIISMMKKEVVAERIVNLWRRDKRLIYFANSVMSMAELIPKLLAYGIPEEDIAVAFSDSKNADKLPATLVAQRHAIRNHLIEHESLPADVKIFITTTQNKEGISIADDDIRYMFSENHNKADLEQMAGRVRGNSENGTGIHALVVIYDADDHISQWNFLECELDRRLADHASEVMAFHKNAIERAGQTYELCKDIAAIETKHRYLRYDYIDRKFHHFTGREMCEQQIIADRKELDSYMELYDEILYYYSDSSGITYAATGRGELSRNWFPYSKVYHAPDRPLGTKETATAELLNYLQHHNWIDVEITPNQADAIVAEICRLIAIHGKSALGFSKEPVTLGPALRKFNMTCLDVSHHNRNKIINLVAEI